ncbi:glycoside hydrolase superfamily [Pyrenochaeta sp. MPI-SDFR-AT-0127]|nr:glycoside hydrolase superfamily [Pyrenochaeta sp. MPI-SDFR-AT-0127]
MPTSLILRNSQAMIDAIRDAGAKQLILVPGNGFSGAQRWLNWTCSDEALGCTPNSDVMMQIVDPVENFAFDMHLYFDNDTSGTHEECTLAAPSSLSPVTQWLQENNYTAFLSEFGAGSNPTCFETLNNTITYLETYPQFVGWTYWSAGSLWGDYFLSVEPDKGTQANSTWPKLLKPHVKSYQPMMRCGISINAGEDTVARKEKGKEGCLGLRLPRR